MNSILLFLIVFMLFLLLLAVNSMNRNLMYFLEKWDEYTKSRKP